MHDQTTAISPIQSLACHRAPWSAKATTFMVRRGGTTVSEKTASEKTAPLEDLRTSPWPTLPHAIPSAGPQSR